MLAFSKKRRAICMTACMTAFRPPFEQGGSVFVPDQAALRCPEISISQWNIPVELIPDEPAPANR